MVRPPAFDAAPVRSTVSADVDRENACSVESFQRRQRQSASDLLDDHRHIEAAADDFEFFQSAAESRRAFGLEHFLQAVEVHEKTERIDAVDKPSNVVRGILDELRKADISEQERGRKVRAQAFPFLCGVIVGQLPALGADAHQHVSARAELCQDPVDGIAAIMPRGHRAHEQGRAQSVPAKSRRNL